MSSGKMTKEVIYLHKSLKSKEVSLRDSDKVLPKFMHLRTPGWDGEGRMY